MKKANLNFLINALMFISMSAIAGIGFLIKFTLLSGQERWLKYSDNVEMYMFGLDRHQWGKIHLIIGIILLGLLIIHIILHWKVICCVYNKIFKKKSTSTIIMILFIAICGLFIVFPFLIKPEITSIEHGRGRQAIHTSSNSINSLDSNRHFTNESKTTESDITSETNRKHKNQNNTSIAKHKNQNDKADKKHKHSNMEIEIRGFMTLNEISKKYKVPTNIIKTKLNIPKSFSNTQRVNRLRRDYDIQMYQIKDVIREYKEDNE